MGAGSSPGQPGPGPHELQRASASREGSSGSRALGLGAATTLGLLAGENWRRERWSHGRTRPNHAAFSEAGFVAGPAPSSSPRTFLSTFRAPGTGHRARASSVPDRPECFPATDPLGLPTTLRKGRHRCSRCTKRETEAPRPALWAHAAASVPTLILERRGASPFRRAGRRGQWPGGCRLNSEPLVPRSCCTPCFCRAEASGQEPEKGHQNQSRGGGDRDRQRFRLASWRRQQRKPAGQGSGGLAPGGDALPRPSPYSAHSSALCLPPAPDQRGWDPQRREALCGLVESCLERPCPPGHPAGECRPQPASPGLGGRHGAPVRGP